MNLSQDFKEFIELLNANHVKYLIIGGYAVSFHGYPRYTKDLDFWIWLNPENATRMIKALSEFGFGNLGLTEADFLVTDNVIQLGYPPNRIDMLTDLEDLDFNVCYEKRIEIIQNGISICFLDKESLIQHKRFVGRLQDLADIEKLTKHHD